MLIQSEISLLELMGKLHCDSGLMGMVDSFGLKVEYKENGVEVIGHGVDTTVKFVAPIKLGVLTSLISGNMPVGGATFMLAKAGIEKAVKQVIDHMDVKKPVTITITSDIDIPDTEGLSDIFKVKPKGKSPDKTPTLRDATDLYQPVKGTDEGSRYYVIALAPGFNVAARIKGKENFSMRLEGDLVKEFKQKLKHVGFDDNGTHCSIHMTAETDDLVRKAIGAMLFSTGIVFDKTATALSSIWGKGK